MPMSITSVASTHSPTGADRPAKAHHFAALDEPGTLQFPLRSIAACLATMDRLRHLDLSRALGGHGLPFDRARLRAIAEDDLRKRS